MKKFIVLGFLYFLCSMFGQQISMDYLLENIIEHSLDNGLNWRVNTAFGINDQRKIIKMDLGNYNYSKIFYDDESFSDSTDTELNIYSAYYLRFDKYLKPSGTLDYFINLNFKDNFSTWLHPRITSNGDHLDNYTGLPRTRRLGFNSGEVDLSGLGYFSNWLNIWYGRSRHNWGTIIGNNLPLSKESPSYESLNINFDLNKYRFSYFHGFLENINDFNRYITGKGIEYTNKKNLLFSFQEIIIYSGLNRSLDFAYLNPISTHLDIELNDRDNDFDGYESQNAIWQMSFDYLLKKFFRISWNIAIDEFALDQMSSDTLSSRNDYAYNIRFCYKNNFLIPSSLIFENIFISKYMFRHSRGENNFVLRNLPLGSNLGSNIDLKRVGIKFLYKDIYFIELFCGLKKIGQNSILNNPYSPNIFTGYDSSENLIRSDFISFKFGGFIKERMKIYSHFEFEKFNKELKNKLMVSIEFYFFKKTYKGKTWI